MRTGIGVSVLLHALIVVIGYFGLPALKRDVMMETPVMVEIVMVSDKTNAPAPEVKKKPKPKKVTPEKKAEAPKPKPAPPKKQAKVAPPPPPPPPPPASRPTARNAAVPRTRPLP